MIRCNVYDDGPARREAIGVWSGDGKGRRRASCRVIKWFLVAACCRCNGASMARRLACMAIYIRTAPVWTDFKNV